MTDRGVLALPVFKASLFLALAFAVAAIFQPGAAQAQVVERGVVGAGVGAIIGGIAGGRRGAGTGALIGGGIGVISGAAEANARQRAYEEQYYDPPPRAYGGGGLVYDIQAQLTRLGYNPGPVDGAYGPRTADAISHYQYTNGLPVDGQPSPGLLRHMMRYGG